MELKGITLKHFWIWYLLPEQRKTYKTDSLKGVDNVAKIRFLAMSFTERWGVYVDFFDSVKIYIEIMPFEGKSFYWLINDNQMNEGETYTRPEARCAAIEKANEIFNK